MKKNILVTGGSGFIGRHLVSVLRREGHDVLCISKDHGNLRSSEFCEFIVGDRCVVIHLAWGNSGHQANQALTADIAENIQGSVTLFQACAKAGTSRVIFVSSGGTVYGIPETVPIDESHPVSPLSSYGIAKATVERYLQFFQVDQGLEYTILRGANAYGPGQNFSQAQGVIGQWLNCLHHRKTLSVYGDGSQIRDYLYVSDFVRAIHNAILTENPASILNVGSGTGHSLLEILEILKSVTGASPSIEFTPARSLDVPENILDCTRAKAELQWKCEVGLEEGIQKTWDWIQDPTNRDR